MKIVHEINGKKYVLINYFVNSQSGLIKMQGLINRYSCILQGGEERGGGLFSSRSANVQILVPEENIMVFNKETIEFEQ